MPPLNLHARVRFSLCNLHTRPRVQRAPGIPCSLSEGECFCKPRANRAARRRSYVWKWLRKRHELTSPLPLAGEVAALEERGGGGHSLHTGSVTRCGTPTPALPRKRERERMSVMDATCSSCGAPRICLRAL